MTLARTLLGAGLLSFFVGAPADALAQGGLAPGACADGLALVGGAGAAVAPQSAQGSSRSLSLARCRAYCEDFSGCVGFSYRSDAARRVDDRGFPAARGEAEATCALFWSVAGSVAAPGTTSCMIVRAPRIRERAAFSKFRDDFDRIDREVRQDTVRPSRPCTNPQLC